MKDNIGFVILHIDKYQSQHIISSIKNFSLKFTNKRILLFNSYNNGLVENLPTLHINQCKFFDGNVFVFDIIGLMIAVSCYNLHKIYYYAFSIPWLDDHTTDFSFWSKLMEDSRVEIIAQNQEIYDTYKKIWKTPIAIAGDISDYEFEKQI